MTQRAAVIVSSTRAAGGIYADSTGPVIVSWLGANGFTVSDPIVVADGDPFKAALTAALDPLQENALVITTGGTGISPTDVTAQITGSLLDYEIPGIAEEIRRRGVEKVPAAMLSRGVSGVAGQTLVINLPGSVGGVKDGLQVLEPIVAHALEQIRGADHAKREGLPPEGGRIAFAGVSEQVLDLDAHLTGVADPVAGATVSFSGTVRNHDHGNQVSLLEYQCHPTASRIVQEVATDIAARPGVIAVAVTHRVGTLAIGDVAIVAAVSSAHRGTAFEACSDLVDEVKKRLPVWKRQVFADGTDEWVGSA